MARYIDAVKTAEIISEKLNVPLGDLVDIFAEIPTADVVPKSEAESLTLELNAMRGAANSYKMHYNNFAKEIFDKIDSIFRNQFEESSKKSELKLLEPLRQSERFVINEMWSEIAKLKKKYTEEKL